MNQRYEDLKKEGTDNMAEDDFEKKVEDYIQKFPYQNTYAYAMQFTGGDAGKLNKWGSTTVVHMTKKARMG